MSTPSNPEGDLPLPPDPKVSDDSAELLCPVVKGGQKTLRRRPPSWNTKGVRIAFDLSPQEEAALCQAVISVYDLESQTRSRAILKDVRVRARKGDAVALLGLGRLFEHASYDAYMLPYALRCYHEAALRGDLEGQYRLGLMYHLGRGVTKNESEAGTWYRKAAEQGHLEAMHALYKMYSGIDKAEADRWRLAYAESCYREGEEMYHGCRMSYSYAFVPVSMYLKAAQLGHREASYTLGTIYFFGADGIAPNRAEAAKWYSKVADEGYPDACTLLGFLYEEGLGVPKDEGEAVKWYSLGARAEHPDACHSLAEFYREGRVVEKDEAEAAKLYHKATRQEDPKPQQAALSFFSPYTQRKRKDACFALGQLYEAGGGVEKNDAEATSWYLEAAQDGHPEACCLLGERYEEGRGVEESVDEAMKWYREATARGYVRARFRMGVLYEEGRGVKKDEGEAAEQYRMAAAWGSAEAYYRLGRLYEEGRGVEKDEAEAMNLYREAKRMKA